MSHACSKYLSIFPFSRQLSTIYIKEKKSDPHKLCLPSTLLVLPSQIPLSHSTNYNPSVYLPHSTQDLLLWLPHANLSFLRIKALLYLPTFLSSGILPVSQTYCTFSITNLLLPLLHTLHFTTLHLSHVPGTRSLEISSSLVLSSCHVFPYPDPPPPFCTFSNSSIYSLLSTHSPLSTSTLPSLPFTPLQSPLTPLTSCTSFQSSFFITVHFLIQY